MCHDSPKKKKRIDIAFISYSMHQDGIVKKLRYENHWVPQCPPMTEIIAHSILQSKGINNMAKVIHDQETCLDALKKVCSVGPSIRPDF